MVIYAAGAVHEAYGPVVLHPSELFRGADRCTNNTGEASALLFLFEWLSSHLSAFDHVVVHYDSEYAMQVSLPRGSKAAVWTSISCSCIVLVERHRRYITMSYRKA